MKMYDSKILKSELICVRKVDNAKIWGRQGWDCGLEKVVYERITLQSAWRGLVKRG